VNLVLIELPNDKSFVINLEKITCIIPTEKSACKIGYDDQSELEVAMTVGQLFQKIATAVNLPK
jgi:hypothetical protein